LDLKAEYTAFCASHHQVRALLPSSEEWVILAQLLHVLKPFKDQTENVSKEIPSLVRSLEIYWEIDQLLDNVDKGIGIYKDLERTIPLAVSAGIKKSQKYKRKLEKRNIMIFAAHVLDPRCKKSLIEEQMPLEAVNIKSVREYLKWEWPETTPDPLTEVKKPAGISSVA
jgi:hypothetical protein